MEYSMGSFSSHDEDSLNSDSSELLDTRKMLHGSNVAMSMHGGMSLDGMSGMSMMDKNSDEYKRRREKNNEAVRRSREKAKIKYSQTEQRILKLRAEKKELEGRVNGMKKELNVLQELAKTFGINPEADAMDTQMSLPDTSNPNSGVSDMRYGDLNRIKTEHDNESYY